MKVLLLTDSLSLPRAYSGGQVRWEDTWVSLLRQALPEVQFIHVGIGAATITELLRLQDYYALSYPNIVILQCGIVDCAPRALGKLEVRIIKKLHLFRLVKPFITLLRKYRGLTYTNASVFEQALLKFKDKFPAVPFVAVGILPGCDEYDAIVPGVSENIDLYNLILRRHTDFVDNADFPREGILADHHHMNEQGHIFLSHKLGEKIRGFIDCQYPVLSHDSTHF